MRTRSRLLLAGLAAALTLAAATTAAPANNLSVSEREFRVTWTRLTFIAAGTSIVCELSLSGRFHARGLSKVTGGLVGFITAASLGRCERGSATVLGETLPWFITYNGFTGTLPVITGVRLNIVNASFRAAGATPCLARTDTAEPFGVTASVEARGQITGLVANSALAIDIDDPGFLCTIAGDVRIEGTGTFRTPAGGAVTTTLIRGEIPPLPPRVVAVGDSFMSGEGGRWAGNTRTLGSTAVDAGTGNTYFDNEAGNAERIARCHRSKMAGITFGDVEAGPAGENLACSGARTTTPAGANPIPGLDLASTGEGRRGQALMLREFAIENPLSIKMVAVSIGGNNFGFADIVRACVTQFIFAPATACKDLNEVRERIEAAQLTARKGEIRQAILEVREGMRSGGYPDETYTLLVHDYPSIVPPAEQADATEDRTTNGCPVLSEDLDWIDTELMSELNRTVWEAASSTGLGNIERLELESAFVGRRLCESTTTLLEDTGLFSWNEEEGLLNVSDWINQLLLAGAPYDISESFHPNYWGQAALRSCMRQAYNGGEVRSGTCTLEGAGLTALGEPRMRFE